MQNIQRVLIRTADGERVVVDPLEVFVLEADEGRTRVRLASRHELVDVREIGELEALFAPFGFTEIHRSQRAWRSQAPLKELRPASGRSATGGRLAPRHGPRRPPVTVSPLLVHRGPRESRASLSTRRGAPAGVPSLRMCRRRFEDAWAHSQGGHPREARHGEACISHQAGRRDARRWPKAFEHENRHLPPQGGEPERRRDEHRSRRKADLSSLSRLAPATAGVSGARGTDPRPFVR
jgi:hypothetical protein